MISSKLAIRTLKREWQAGELRVLVGAIVIAVTCVTAVLFFTDRISLALTEQASELLGADLRLSMDHKIDNAHIDYIKKLSLETATTLSFRSMVSNGNQNHLAEIKAVSDTYPLRGGLHIKTTEQSLGKRVANVPAMGNVWVEASILSQLNLNLGEEIDLGESKFKIAAIITYEPDRSGDMFSIAPRVMLNLADLSATKLVQEGSRIRYRYLVAGKADKLALLKDYLKPKLKPGESIEGVKDARNEIRFALDRAQQFLGLAALVSVILSCVAIAMSARRYAERHLDTCAIMRCVGATQSQISQLYIQQLLVLGIGASILGCFLGYVSQIVLTNLLGSLVVVTLPAASFTPVLSGLAVGLVGLIGFAIPPILRLRDVPTLRVLRRDLGALPPFTMSSYLLGVSILAGLLFWLAGDAKLGLYIILGIFISILSLVLIAKMLIRLLGLFPESNSIAWRFGLNNIIRRPTSSVVQIVAFGVGIMVLLLLTLVRSDILSAWEDRLPPDASNRFVINIQPHQVEKVSDYFKQQGLVDIELYPMVRARLLSINDQPIDINAYANQRAKNLVQREFNLSWADHMQSDNKIVAGSWWAEANKEMLQFSVEIGIAKTLGVKLGDTLVFGVAGDTMTAKITSLRTVQWDTFKPNFFVLTPSGTLAGYPASYITSFYLQSKDQPVLDKLVRTFPNLTVVDISAIMDQIRTIIDRVALAVEYVFSFTLLAGLMVLYAAIQATKDERMRENAILRALGAGKTQLIKGMLAEFSMIGAIAGIMAAIFASILAYVITAQLLKLPYSFNPYIILIGFVAGTVGIGMAGSLSTRKVLSKPPIQVLRET